MNAEIKKRFSCRRKRDIMTFFAVTMFFFLVAFQLYLVLIAPAQLKRRGALEKSVAKLEMLTQTDTLRRSLRSVKATTGLQTNEIALVVGVVDTITRFIRAEQDDLEMKEIYELKHMLDRYGAICFRWRSKPPRFYIQREEIAPEKYWSAIEKDL